MLLFAPDGAVLLIRFLAELQGRPYTFWVTPGGEVERNESDLDAAARELDEELGLRPPLYGPVHQESGGQYTHLGETVRNFDVFFAARCNRDSPRLRGVTADEVRLMQEIRWWHPDELRATADPVFPPNLAHLSEVTFRALKSAESGFSGRNCTRDGV